MRRITEIYTSLWNEELYMEGTELVTTEETVLSEEEKTDILNKALKEVCKEIKETKRGSHRLFGKKRLGILILAAVLLMALTASAAGYFQLKKELADSLGILPDDASKQLASMMTDLSEEEVSATVNGVTVRAEQAISDGRTACIIFEIELPEGIFLQAPNAGLSERETLTHGSGPVSWTIRHASDDDADIIYRWREVYLNIGGEVVDNGSMIIERSMDDPDRYYAVERIDIEGQTDRFTGPQKIKMVLTNLGYVYADAERTEWTTQIEGTWTLEWTMEFEDMSRTYEVEKDFQKGDITVHMQTVQVSPLGMRMTGTTEAEGTGGDFLSLDDIITRDGCGASPDLMTVWSIGERDGTVIVDAYFQKLMEADDVAGVRINGEDWFFCK